MGGFRRGRLAPRRLVAVGVEGRVEVYEVDGCSVDAREDFYVVRGPDGAVGKVHVTLLSPRSRRRLLDV